MSIAQQRFGSATLRRALTALLLAVSVAAHAAQGPDAAPGEILVKLRTTAALGRLLTKYGFGFVDQFGARPIYRLRVPGTASVHDAIEALAVEADVLIAEPNFLHETPEARKNVVWAIGRADDFAAQWAPSAIHLAEAQRVTIGAGVRVAVLDTGVDLRHPLLAPRLLPGFDFVDFDRDPSEALSPGVAYGHGTHVAGTIAMVAPGARIMPLRVLDGAGQGNGWVIAEALLYAIDPDGNPNTDDGAHVINLSLGSIGRTRMLDTVAQLVTCSVPDDPAAADDLSDRGYDDDRTRCSQFGGAVIVAAAGNDASTVREYPAAEGAYGLIAVAASNAQAHLADFSNFGSWVTLAAPGERITSSVPGGRYGTWSGTSMAAPLVAGTAALIRSIDPALTPDGIERRIARHAGALCGTPLRQLDAGAAVMNRPAADAVCR